MNTKKCPFCACDESGFKTVMIGGHYEYRVICLNCDAHGPNYLSKDLATKSWNMRREVYPPAQADVDAYEDDREMTPREKLEELEKMITDMIEVPPSADAYTDLRTATPEQLLEAAMWFYRESADQPDLACHFIELGFLLARPGGWQRVAPMWLRESQKLAALDE